MSHASAQAIAIKKEEKSHLQQLVRDLVQGDANLQSGTGATATEGFDQIPYIVKQVFQVRCSGILAGKEICSILMIFVYVECRLDDKMRFQTICQPSSPKRRLK